jgi:HNH endonuclease
MDYMKALVKRFWPKVDKNGPIPEYRPELGQCWIWTRGCTGKGYGAFKVRGKQTPAHRVAYELSKGDIPEGLDLDHLCRVRNCVNPDHLEPVTSLENIRRGYAYSAVDFRKTHCPQGHPYEGENVASTSTGGRRCRECSRKRGRDAWEAKTGKKFGDRKTHCPQGHPYDKENTYVKKGGSRNCRACHRAQSNARYRRLKESRVESESPSTLG